jgi:hypothetical protein
LAPAANPTSPAVVNSAFSKPPESKKYSQRGLNIDVSSWIPVAAFKN